MTPADPIDPRPDAELAVLLSDVEGEPELGDPDALFREVRMGMERSDGNAVGWLRSRSTPVRRTIALSAFLAVAAFGLLSLRPDIDSYPVPRMIASLVALAVLLILSLHHAIRPLHEPALGRGTLAALTAVALGATFVIAAVPISSRVDPLLHGSWIAGVVPCLMFGVLVGLPVYVVARLVDRGSVLGGVLAACAAGLTANFVLQLHCPMSAPSHDLLGHFGAAVIFVGAALIVTLIERQLRSVR